MNPNTITQEFLIGTIRFSKGHTGRLTVTDGTQTIVVPSKAAPLLAAELAQWFDVQAINLGAVAVQVNPDAIRSCLAAAFGPGDLWSWCLELVDGEKPATPIPDNDDHWTYAQWYPTNGGSIIVYAPHPDTDERTRYEIDGEAINRGLCALARIAPDHFGDLANDTGDSITGDVFVQCCIYGEIVYS